MFSPKLTVVANVTSSWNYQKHVATIKKKKNTIQWVKSTALISKGTTSPTGGVAFVFWSAANDWSYKRNALSTKQAMLQLAHDTEVNRSEHCRFESTQRARRVSACRLWESTVGRKAWPKCKLLFEENNHSLWPLNALPVCWMCSSAPLTISARSRVFQPVLFYVPHLCVIFPTLDSKTAP